MRYLDPPTEFMSKIQFHMLRVAMYPHRSIEFTEMLMKKDSCEHTQRVCRSLIFFLGRFKPAEEVPTLKSVERAAKSMWNGYFGDHYVRAAGGFLNAVLREMSETVETSPDCSESTSRQRG